MKKNLTLFFTMLKIGLFTFGGGYAMISFLQSEFVEKKQYMEKDEFLDMVAIAESTPGPIAINAATYIGYKQSRFLGALIATVAICIPSFLIIFAISLFLDAFLSFELVRYAFRGIQVCVIYLIFTAGLKMLKQMKKNAFSVSVLLAVMLCMVTLSLFAIKFSSVLYIIICGAAGLVFHYSLQMRKNQMRKKEEKK